MRCGRNSARAFTHVHGKRPPWRTAGEDVAARPVDFLVAGLFSNLPSKRGFMVEQSTAVLTLDHRNIEWTDHNKIDHATPVTCAPLTHPSMKSA